MKKVLKGWIADNSVTADKTDKILVLESAGKVDIDDILEEMLKEDTGLRPETLRHAVELYNRIVMDFILNGYQVNTGLFYAVAKLTGILESGVWNKANNSIYVSHKGRIFEERSPKHLSVFWVKRPVLCISLKQKM